MTTVSAAVAEVVAEHTTEVFALMGNGNAHVTDALARHGSTTITAVRHEAATVASADAYHRISRRPAVATTTYGPGFTNALTALAEARAARTPLVYVVGDAPSSGLREGDVEQQALAAALGVPAVTVDATGPRAAARRAFEIAAARRVPVVLLVPYDTATAEAAAEAIPWRGLALPDPAPEVDHAAVAGASSVLAAAQRPLVLAGRGARHAAGRLGELADRLGALTASTAPARGAFAGREWDLGVCGGFASEESSELIHRADVVLAVGAGLNRFTTAFGTQFAPGATIVQVDLEPAFPQAHRHLAGDAEEIATALLAELGSAGAPARQRWDGLAQHARSSRLHHSRDRGAEFAGDGRLDPRGAVARIDEILPADRQVVTDGGHFLGWPNAYLEVTAPDGLTMVGTASQAIGLGLPSAPGAVRARPEATTVVVTGDGGGIMGLPDLDSLIRTARSALVLVVNDACYGAEIHQYGSRGFDERIMNIDQADFATLAEGFGARGVVATTLRELDAVEDWVRSGARGTLVVDVRISRAVVAPYMRELVRELAEEPLTQ
ncbi:thiamine pyrophosphate-binding protein [Bounagaea algeriensis]